MSARIQTAVKNATARVPHPVPENFGGICARMPPCSGVAMGFDRLIMLLGGKTTLEPFLYSGLLSNLLLD